MVLTVEVTLLGSIKSREVYLTKKGFFEKVIIHLEPQGLEQSSRRAYILVNISVVLGLGSGLDHSRRQILILTIPSLKTTSNHRTRLLRDNQT